MIKKALKVAGIVALAVAVTEAWQRYGAPYVTDAIAKRIPTGFEQSNAPQVKHDPLVEWPS